MIVKLPNINSLALSLCIVYFSPSLPRWSGRWANTCGWGVHGGYSSVTRGVIICRCCVCFLVERMQTQVAVVVCCCWDHVHLVWFFMSLYWDDWNLPNFYNSLSFDRDYAWTFDKPFWKMELPFASRWTCPLHHLLPVYHSVPWVSLVVFSQEPKSSKTETWIGEIKSFNPINGYLAVKISEMD